MDDPRPTNVPGPRPYIANGRRVRKPKWTPQMQAFVNHYLGTWDHGEAYKFAYQTDDDRAALSNGRRLLRHPIVSRKILEASAEAYARTGSSTEDLVKRLWLTYHRAHLECNRSAELKALELLGKIAGAFEKDNRQKAGTDTADAIRERLRNRGIDVDRLFPNGIKAGIN